MVDLRYNMLQNLWALCRRRTGKRMIFLIGCLDDDRLEGCCMLVPVDKITVQLHKWLLHLGCRARIGRVNAVCRKIFHATRAARKLLCTYAKPQQVFGVKTGLQKKWRRIYRAIPLSNAKIYSIIFYSPGVCFYGIACCVA